MKIAVCDDDRTTREQIVSLIREQDPDAEVVTFESGEKMMKSQENFAVSFLYRGDMDIVIGTSRQDQQIFNLTVMLNGKPVEP